MDNFYHIPDAQVILRTRGVFRPAKVFRRGDRLYAQLGTGFIRLGGGDVTSCPSVSYEALDLPDSVSVALTLGPTREPLIDIKRFTT